MTDIGSVVMILTGAFFFTAGTVGLIRFPDARSKLHALTKADNLGLGLILAGVALRLGSPTAAGVLVLTWLLALGAASTSAQILAGIEAREAHTPDASAGTVDTGHGEAP